MSNHEKQAVEIIKGIYPIADNLVSKLFQEIEYKSIPKEEVFIKKDTRNENEYFVLSGICRSYLNNHEGNDVTISFFEDGSIITPNVTRTSNYISSLNFQALTDIELATFPAFSLVELMREYTDYRNFANTVLQNELTRKVNKEISFASLSAKDRLLEFRQLHHALENLIPHPMIASYLGITNISLSRLRRDLMKE